MNWLTPAMQDGIRDSLCSSITQVMGTLREGIKQDVMNIVNPISEAITTSLGEIKTNIDKTKSDSVHIKTLIDGTKEELASLKNVIIEFKNEVIVNSDGKKYAAAAAGGGTSNNPVLSRTLSINSGAPLPRRKSVYDRTLRGGTNGDRKRQYTSRHQKQMSRNKKYTRRRSTTTTKRAG